MDGQVAVQRLLYQNFVLLKGKNPSYSLRAFSNRVGLSSSALSEIFNGKRRISRKIVERLVEKLCLGPAEAKDLLKHFPKKNRLSQKSSESLRKSLILSADQFKLISEWYHFAILSLAETEDFQSDIHWIASRLGLNHQDAFSAIERLKRLEMLHSDENGTLKCTGRSYQTTDEIISIPLRRSHAVDLELIRNSLEKDSVCERDITGLTLVIDPEKIPEAKKMIRKFRDRFCADMESGDKKEVYKLCIQFIPLTKKERQ